MCFAQGGEHNMWCTEQIVLEARAEALPSAVTSLLLPDLPVFLWWQGTTASGGRVMRPLAEAATRLVVNSDECGLDRLAELDPTIDVRPDDRFVDSGEVVTAAGVSAGIDMALHLIRRLHSEERAREVRRYIQYDPAPPV
jgi:hypothetical protein